MLTRIFVSFLVVGIMFTYFLLWLIGHLQRHPELAKRQSTGIFFVLRRRTQKLYRTTLLIWHRGFWPVYKRYPRQIKIATFVYAVAIFIALASIYAVAFLR